MANGGAAAGRRRCRDSLQHSFSHDYRPFTLLPSPLPYHGPCLDTDLDALESLIHEHDPARSLVAGRWALK